MSQEDKIAKAVKDAKVILSHGQALEGSDSDSGQTGEHDVCPVTAIGTLDGNYYFISPSGEVRRLSPRDFTDKFLASIFGGRIEWLCRNFPAITRKGQKDYSRFPLSIKWRHRSKNSDLKFRSSPNLTAPLSTVICASRLRCISA
jgi:hypothetical protein